ncbi:SAM-dependent methyltransferase [Leptospira barantonii]|uniref:SAM-dependent methyltransferase n=1 Tax=Leptospira barantonii TaxID=2023184 RepID=A0A5F2B6P0_9LEPT|nr:class I SAM-dependent methyltransferase [Leptospira barantonii]TGM01017.1 SAM-dependent methyltransferase [Leptospira barantonii]
MNRKSELSIQRKHPWIFSGNLSTATSTFSNGQWLNLVSTENEPVATGIYSSAGLVRIRVIQFAPSFSKEKIRENLISALKRRAALRAETNAYRILHGENDFFPGITIDRISQTWVVRIYSSSLLAYGRWLVWNLYDICKNSKLEEPQPKRILFDPPEKTGEDKVAENDTNGVRGVRLWRGEVQSGGRERSERSEHTTQTEPDSKTPNRSAVKIRETIRLGKIRFPVELPGQKGGIFLDLRNLRRFLLEKKELSAGRDCLHLFSHTGLTSICMDEAGASSVLSVDGSKEVLDSFQRVLSIRKDETKCKHRFVQKNLFQELEDVLKDKTFGLIVIDPPNLTPDAKSKKNALKTYSYLFANALESLKESGTIILCSCSGRIASEELETLAKNILKTKGIAFEHFTSLKPEADHPVRKNFPEGNYFKVHIYENCKKN